MKLAFYNAQTELFNQAVCWWDRSPHSHVEVVLQQLEDGRHLCGSSSFRDGGVRIKAIDLSSGHWDVVDIGGTPAMEEAAHLWFATHIGQGYDVLGLAGFIVRRIDGEKDLWFCSEAVAAALGLPEPWRYDPATLYSLAMWLNKLMLDQLSMVAHA